MLIITKQLVKNSNIQVLNITVNKCSFVVYEDLFELILSWYCLSSERSVVQYDN